MLSGSFLYALKKKYLYIVQVIIGAARHNKVICLVYGLDDQAKTFEMFLRLS